MELIDNELTGANSRAQQYLDTRRGEPSSVSGSHISEKLANVQKQEVLARKEAEKVRAVVGQKEAEFSLMKKKMQEEHEAQMRKMEALMLEEQMKLKSAEANLAYCQAELDKTMNEELGLSVAKPEIKHEIKPDIKQMIWKTDDNPATVTAGEPQYGSKGPVIQLGHDMWRQLEKVSIPIFSGQKPEYESWKAAFISCVDAAPATPQYKLLQLKKYLSGEPLKSVKKLGHSAAAYKTALERLDRKYGGKRRQIALVKEEIDSIRPLRDGVAKDMEMFSDALDVCVANLIEVDSNLQ